MEGGDALGLIAEVSIAVAGFAGLTSATIWTLSSSAMAALVAAVFLGTIHIGYARGALPALGNRAPGQRLFTPYAIGMPTGIIVLQLANALFFRQLWPFFLGLLARTAHSLLLFAYILFAPSRAEVQA